jgi:hypothetical protein
MTEIRTFRVFYMFYGSTDDVPSEAPVEMSEDELMASLFPRLKSDGDFLGIVDEAGGCLQMNFYNPDSYWVRSRFQPKKAPTESTWASRK